LAALITKSGMKILKPAAALKPIPIKRYKNNSKQISS